MAKRTTNAAPKKSRRDWKPAFLRQLALTCNITAAARAVRVDRMTVYRHRDADPEFAAAIEDAIEQGVDDLELEARRRAKDGCDRPVYQGGALVGSVREYSDTLMIFLLKAHRPEKYRDNHKHEISGPDGKPVPITVVEIVKTAADPAADIDP